MAKARAIVKRRKSVRNIRKITKTMQMIATAKFQKSLKRAVGGKPFTSKVHEIVEELVRNVESFRHPLMQRSDGTPASGKVALLVLSSNRGLAGGYNGNLLRKAVSGMRELEAAGSAVDLYVAGKKGAAFFTFQKYRITERFDAFVEQPTYPGVQELADRFMELYTSGQLDALYVVYMNFVSAGVQRPAMIRLLPLEPAKATAADSSRAVQYDLVPSPQALLDDMLPLTVRLTLYQCFMEATTSENVARMVAMKSATDNADKMIKSLSMQYNRARQSQITTELSEIMGGVEAMKS